MKCTIPEISWHNREPVLSVDINPISSDCYRLATSGGDSHVLIWHMYLIESGAVRHELVSDLTRHQRAVNVVRWSPSGQYLASADDDANIIIWQLKTDNIPLLEGDTGDKEVWIVHKILRGHKEDIYDLCWSADGLKLFSGSIDNTAILWDFAKGKMDHILSDHKGFVQGVTWDPKDQLIATISTDRICRIFSTNGKQVKARIHKGHIPVPSNHYLYEKEIKYFHDDTFKSFFRRLQFSPEGSILVVPSGHVEADDCKKVLNATLVFTFENLNEPVAVLPLTKQCSTAVRFCPILFELHEDGPDPIINLPYRMIFAVSTDHDVILYDTQQKVPFARFQEIHYTRLTDLTWSSDGRLLIASSTDGFCALITFDVDELGVPYVKEESETEDNPMDISGCEELEKDENEDRESEGRSEKKRPSFIEQWAIRTPKRIKLEEDKRVSTDEVIDISDDEEDVKELPNEIREEIKKLIPRRATCRVENEKVNEDKVVAKPIAVRRKPKPEQGTKEEDKMVAKPIAVRRKPKPEQGTKEGDKMVAKPIAVRRKPKPEQVSKEDVVHTEVILKRTGADFKENTPLNRVTEPETRSDVKENREINGEPEVIEIEDTDSTALQKQDTKPEETKVKASSSIKKPTPRKENPLLRFLKTSNKKSGATPKKGGPSRVDLTLAEEEARDAWKCEKEVKESGCQGGGSSNVRPAEDDCTEEFSLQLEDTQESVKKNVKSDEVTRIGDDAECQNEVGSAKTIARPEAKPQSKDEKNSLACGSKLGDTKQRAPRRVALITLASPKAKRKQKP